MTQQRTRSRRAAPEKPRPPSAHEIVRRSIRTTLPHLEKILPEAIGLNPERFASVAINCIESDASGKLLKCTPGSLVRAVLHAAEVGLEPGGAYGHCYILPWWNKDLDQFEAQFMIGVWGYVELARRNPRIRNIWSDVICEADHYEVRSGTSGKVIDHQPRWELPLEQRGEVIGAYGCALLDDGTVSAELMNRQDLDQARATSQAPNSPAWKNWPLEMYKRSAIKRAQKYWPKGADQSLRRAIEIEEGGPLNLHTQAALREVPEAQPRPRTREAAKPAAPVRSEGKALDELVDLDQQQRAGQQPPRDGAVELQAVLSDFDARWDSDANLERIRGWSDEQRATADQWASEAVLALSSGQKAPRPPSHVSLPREPGEEG